MKFEEYEATPFSILWEATISNFEKSLILEKHTSKCINCEHYRKNEKRCRFVDTRKENWKHPTRYIKCFVFTRKGV